MHPATRGITFLGRADGVLNPSGVRFGSAEIYAVVERNFADRVADSICVGQRRPRDPDESVLLFLLMRPGAAFDRRLAADVRAAVAAELTKRHVPRYVFETPEIPVRNSYTYMHDYVNNNIYLPTYLPACLPVCLFVRPSTCTGSRVSGMLVRHWLLGGVDLPNLLKNFCSRPPSTSRRSSCPSSRSCRDRSSSRAERCSTRAAWTTITDSRRWRSWLTRRRSCEGREPYGLDYIRCYIYIYIYIWQIIWQLAVSNTVDRSGIEPAFNLSPVPFLPPFSPARQVFFLSPPLPIHEMGVWIEVQRKRTTLVTMQVIIPCFWPTSKANQPPSNF